MSIFGSSMSWSGERWSKNSPTKKLATVFCCKLCRLSNMGHAYSLVPVWTLVNILCPFLSMAGLQNGNSNGGRCVHTFRCTGNQSSLRSTAARGWGGPWPSLTCRLFSEWSSGAAQTWCFGMIGSTVGLTGGSTFLGVVGSSKHNLQLELVTGMPLICWVTFVK